MNLGENIHKLRTDRNMSQGDLAAALDVSRQSVSKWENNSAVPELDKLLKMSALFGITLDELVGKTDSPAAPSRNNRPLSAGQILALILIGAGLLFLPFALSASGYRAACIHLILSAAFILSGIFTFLSRSPGIWCGWVILGAFSLYVFHLTHWEEAYPSLILIFLLLCGLLWLTIRAHRKGTIQLPGWLWWVSGLILAGLLILFWINFVPPFWVGTSDHISVPS